jgi:hypothetical protein
MLCIPKKNGKLHMVFDLREQNDNMVKDVMPFPDQDNIRHDVAHCAYGTKLNMSEAYEQIHVRPADIPKTAFATVLGRSLARSCSRGTAMPPRCSNAVLEPETMVLALITKSPQFY